MENEEMEKLFVDFRNHMKNSEAAFRHKNSMKIADLLADSKFKDLGSEFFLGGYMAAFEDLKRIGRI